MILVIVSFVFENIKWVFVDFGWNYVLALSCCPWVFSTSFLYVTSLVQCDNYVFELCALVIMMAELRFYLKCVDFRSGLAPWVAAWSLM